MYLALVPSNTYGTSMHAQLKLEDHRSTQENLCARVDAVSTGIDKDPGEDVNKRSPVTECLVHHTSTPQFRGLNPGLGKVVSTFRSFSGSISDYQDRLET
ncbi:hypothetical protein TNCV_475341 [Trichonephila clavipes]|nr:hypothetical protein TNCV_475341 [Trichonephila clavipes]